MPKLSGKELSLIRKDKWVRTPYSVQKCLNGGMGDTSGRGHDTE